MTDTAAMQEISIEMDHALAVIKEGDALKRLHENADFKLIVTEGYFKEHAAELVGIKAAPQMGSPEKQAQLLKEIDGVGCLQQYFSRIYAMAHNAEMTIESGRQAMSEEEAGDDE